MADEGLYIPIQFSMDEARAALRQIEGDAKKSGQSVQAGLDAGGRSAAGMDKGLRGLKESMGRSRETAMFFTSALAEFGPQGRTVQVALSGVLGVFLGGGGLLAALSLGQAAVRVFTDRNREAAETAKAAADAVAEETRNAIAMTSAVHAAYAQLGAWKMSDEQKYVEAAVSPIQARIASLNEKKKVLEAEALSLQQSKQEDEAKAKNRDASVVRAEIGWLEIDAERVRREALQDFKEKSAAEAAEKDAAARKAEAEKARASEAATRAQIRRDNIEWGEKGIADDLAIAEREEAAKISAAVAGEEAKAAALRDINDRERRWRDDENAKAAAREKAETDARVAALKDIAQSAFGEIRSLLTSELFASMTQAGTVNQRFTREYSALSKQRRAETLVEQGVAKTFGEAQAMVAEESQAAEDAKTAAVKEGMAQRLASMAIEWGIKAIGAAADLNWGSAALYAAAAAAAGGAAATLHGQAADLTQGRGYTAEENDQLSGMRSGSGAREYGGGGASGGGGERVVRETVVLMGAAWMTEADIARGWARAQKTADRLGYSRGSGVDA